MEDRALKDERLADLARNGNVAQFVSFSPGSEPRLRFARIAGTAPDYPYLSVYEAIAALMGSPRSSTQSRTVNIRSFTRDSERGNPFEYGLTNVEVAVDKVCELAESGYFTIVNETIDVDDGGVSGVSLADIVEFVPGDTPRGVEKPGTLSLDRSSALKLLETVYGFPIDIPREFYTGYRIEFSVHPLRVGYRKSHTILWEESSDSTASLTPAISWPNKFSAFLGDKAFGLLLASIIGLRVPRTTVLGRNVAPFSFGESTSTGEYWMRTCPPVPAPGLHPTTYGWVDPFDLLSKSNLDSSQVASVIAQESVPFLYSGAAQSESDGHYKVEGVAGRGDNFMLGEQSPEELPNQIAEDVVQLGREAEKSLGPVRFEYVHDGKCAWVIQLHLAHVNGRGRAILSSGADPKGGWLQFDPTDGLDSLRSLIDQAIRDTAGIEVLKPVGMTSHVGELLRKNGLPSRFA